MSNDFGLRDSGNRREFGTGSVRDAAGATKFRPDALSPFAAERFGEHMQKGAAKYGWNNWAKGQPVSEMFASLYRHVILFQQGDRVEDHLAAIIFGAQGIIHFEELAKRGDRVALQMLDAYASQVLHDELERAQTMRPGYEATGTQPEEPPEEPEYQPPNEDELCEFGFMFGPSINGDHAEPEDWLST